MWAGRFESDILLYFRPRANENACTFSWSTRRVAVRPKSRPIFSTRKEGKGLFAFIFRRSVVAFHGKKKGSRSDRSAGT